MALTQLTTAQVDNAINALDPIFHESQPNADEANGALKSAGNFHKTLQHDSKGYVDSTQFTNFVSALTTAQGGGTFAALDAALPAFSSKSERLTNPAAGLAEDIMGVDPRLMPFAPAPSVTSEQCAVEMKELYWMSLLRDVHFSDYASNATVTKAVNDLNSNNGAMKWLGGSDLTPQLLFRGNDIAGASVGPYISQFMYKPVRFGSEDISQKQETAAAHLDYMLDAKTFLEVENGLWTGRDGHNALDPVKRFIRNGRDLGHYVHIDALYEAYFNAMLILLGMNALADSGNPYPSNRMKAFATFGGPHILSLMTEIASKALKAVWHQKWYVHRRLRPEAYAGLVHFSDPNLHSAITSSAVIAEVQARTGGTRLLPMAFPEGSPTHPAYGAGHATVAGACVTILKAWFDEDVPMLNPEVPNADGTELVAYTGPGATEMTVGGELNKLAANIAIGRNFAGVHWFTDYSESIRLGERVATILLLKQSRDYFEDFELSYTNFDGKQVKISAGGTINVIGDNNLEDFYKFHGNLFVIGGDYYQLM
jgi:membrane-associated phospholipid phosphatase